MPRSSRLTSQTTSSSRTATDNINIQPNTQKKKNSFFLNLIKPFNCILLILIFFLITMVLYKNYIEGDFKTIIGETDDDFNEIMKKTSGQRVSQNLREQEETVVPKTKESLILKETSEPQIQIDRNNYTKPRKVTKKSSSPLPPPVFTQNWALHFCQLINQEECVRSYDGNAVRIISCSPMWTCYLIFMTAGLVLLLFLIWSLFVCHNIFMIVTGRDERTTTQGGACRLRNDLKRNSSLVSCNEQNALGASYQRENNNNNNFQLRTFDRRTNEESLYTDSQFADSNQPIFLNNHRL